jgi:hypothetical protein
MLLADSAAPPRYHYGIGFLRDAGALPSSRVSAADAAYTEMRDALQNEWRRYGPACCDGCGQTRDARIAPPHSNELPPANAWEQHEWPKGGYGPDPSAEGGSMWPDPFDLQSQREGQDCTVNGAPGTLRRAQGGSFVCVPRGRDAAASNIAPAGSHPIGGEWPEGGDCNLGNGDCGLLVKQDGRLVCKPRSDFDAATVNITSAQAKRDAAYHASVAAMQDAWKEPWRTQP